MNEETHSLVVLNARIFKHQMQALHEVAQKNNTSIAELLRDLITQALPTYSPAQDILGMKMDKVFTVVANIYATQMAAKTEASLQDIPEGVFLIPTSKEKGMFACQGCGQDRPKKRKHQIQIMDEILIFGDCCYFTDRYKDFVRQLL